MRGFPEHRHENGGLIVYGTRLEIPASLRRDVTTRLHQSHKGIERTKLCARLRVYWPGIDRDVTNVVSSCSRCRQVAPSHANEPL